MWSIFNRKSQPYDLSWMEVDMHSHILPGLDDGCANTAESMKILRHLADLNLKQLYFTPHVFKEMYPNTVSHIERAFAQLSIGEFAGFFGGYAAEYMVDSHFEQLLKADEKLLTLPTNLILIEMSYAQEYNQIERMILDLLIEGYNPILAHPERYKFYHGNVNQIRRLREIGCLLQVNLLSVTGYYGMHEKRMAKYLASEGLVDLVGTDIHHERNVMALEHSLRREDLYRYFKKCHLINQEIFHKLNQ